MAALSSPDYGEVARNLTSPTDLGYSLRRYYVDEFYSRYASSIPSDSRVLDLGGNKVRKRGRFDIDRYGLRVFYANLTSAKKPDVQADAASVPFSANQFDALICAEMLEHVPDPPAVLRETHRVLRDGGVLLFSVPFLHRIHGDPFDYGRYTDTYWRETLEAIGFRDLNIERQGLFWSVFVDMLRDWLYNTGDESSSGRRRWSIFRIMGAIGTRVKLSVGTGAIGWALRRAIARDAQSQPHAFYSSFTTGFGVRAVKP